MDSRDNLAAAALETLPITVAILDDEGEILLTNQSWRTFEGEEIPNDHIGVNYVATAAMDRDDDEHAEQAVNGITAVLAGEQETFSMEYPCHSPEEKRWFLMRASRFTVDDETRVSVVHLDITERKLAEIAAEASAEQVREEHRALEHVLHRVDGLIRDVTDAAVGAGNRDDIERRVCQRLVDTEPYVLAWIGRVDVATQRITPQAWAGHDDVPLEDADLVLDAGDAQSHPAVQALEGGDSHVIQDIATFDDADRWWPTCAGERFHSVVAIPLEYGDVTYGVLVLFADEPNVFDGRELPVLESLAGTVSTALNAIETRRMLTTETVVELEVAIEDSSLFVTALANALEATLTYRGITYDEHGTPLAFFHVDRTAGVVDAAADIDAIERASVVTEYEEGVLLEVALSSGLVTALANHGAMIQRLDVDDRVADLALELPNGQSARSAYNTVTERYDRVELLSYHETDQPTQTPRDITAQLDERLTDRQQMALRKAYYANYFEWPRDVSGEELADSMGVSRSTFHQHLRAAQRKLLEELFAADPTSEG
ncbi:GAF domain-containing protein [Natronolimnobius sp. AArcel1]|uniref:bacterio-opsin activator domain-containing protein n=1 Tax=Natronolimnobius sp. AArcel1 TaxID=1679093 RepID=UPI0013EA3219|nr:bacterio-opsin activator domain-containing protein [Natronolimnobius sp. AArcel1]NGM67904.1 GAF domain-containing protein [Natronolimnobius sp. AArcel1]